MDYRNALKFEIGMTNHVRHFPFLKFVEPIILIKLICGLWGILWHCDTLKIRTATPKCP